MGPFIEQRYLGSGGITHFFIKNNLHQAYNEKSSAQASEV